MIPYLDRYPRHDGGFYNNLKLADVYLQDRSDAGEDVEYLRYELSEIFAMRDKERLNTFIRKVAYIREVEVNYMRNINGFKVRSLK